MPTPSERQQMFERIRLLPSQLEAAVAGLTDQQLDTPYRAGGWTVHQVVHHLADSHYNGHIRMKLALTEDRPTLKTYEQDDWAKLTDYTGPIHSSLSILKGLHERWTTLLKSLPDAAWSRSALHPESGSLTVDDLLVTYSKHGANHAGQITKLRSEKGW